MINKRERLRRYTGGYSGRHRRRIMKPRQVILAFSIFSCVIIILLMIQQNNTPCSNLLHSNTIDIREYSLKRKFWAVMDTWILKEVNSGDDPTMLRNRSKADIAKFNKILSVGSNYDVHIFDKEEKNWMETGWTIKENLFTFQHSKFIFDYGKEELNTIQYGFMNHMATFVYNGTQYESPQGYFNRLFTLTKDLFFSQPSMHSNVDSGDMTHLYIRKMHFSLLPRLKICVGHVPFQGGDRNRIGDEQNTKILKQAVQGGAVALTFHETIQREKEQESRLWRVFDSIVKSLSK